MRRVAEARGCRKNWRQWVNAVAAELRALGQHKRANSLEICGTRALAHKCECGVRHVHPLISCGLRSCPFCSRRDASIRADNLARAMTVLANRNPTKRWRFLTLTSRWDPSDPEQVTVQSLRSRVCDLFRRWSCVWTALRDHCGAIAAYVSCELSDRGHIHLHAVVLSQWIDRGWLAGLWGAFVDVREARRNSAKELAKYATKSHSPADTQWVAGRHRRLIHPRLAARFEAATVGAHLRRSYGELRGVDLTETNTEAVRQEWRCDCGRALPDARHWDVVDTFPYMRRLVRAKARIQWHFRPLPDASIFP